ncbi:MAG: DUF4179 domain-containing protein [Eubacteriales bacterium]|nr:DUF4179 domain-containing protein [Eubacteriales bacterium]
MLHERYQHMMQQIAPSDALVHEVCASAQNKQNYPKIRRLLRPAAAVLAACMGLVIAMPALAANVEPVYQVMYTLSPSMAQFFMPVHLSDEKNGIRMEVESAYIYGNTAEIYITMQDLTGDRIDATMDLNDSYDIHIPFSSVSGCEMVDYDENTKTARLYIRIEFWNGTNNSDIYRTVSEDEEGHTTVTLNQYGVTLAEARDVEQVPDILIMQVNDEGNAVPVDDVNIEGDKITFSLGSFTSKKKEYSNIQIPIDWTKVQETEDTQEVELNGYSAADDTDVFPDTAQALIPSEPQGEFPVDGVEMTGLAYANGQLHVQIQSEPSENLFDGNGGFWLEKADGTRVESTCSYMFHIGEQKWQETADGSGHYANSTRYDEYVFDIPQDEIEEYQLMGDFVTAGIYVDGGWRVTFPLKEEK